MGARWFGGERGGKLTVSACVFSVLEGGELEGGLVFGTLESKPCSRDGFVRDCPSAPCEVSGGAWRQ